MSRRVVGAGLERPKRNNLPRFVVNVDRRLRFDVQAEHQARLHSVVVQKQIVLVKIHRYAQRILRCRDASHMINVRVGQQNVADRQAVSLYEREQTLDFIARIDDHRLARLFAPDDEAVFHEGTDGSALDYHSCDMILAVLDDLMFSSKIKTAANQLGVPLVFARSSASALAEMRKSVPSLVIFDLNNPRTDPLGTVAAMHADPVLAAIPTVGYVSHVDTEAINAARQAGVTEVLPRSAFTVQLADILRRA
jgi:CheY-like chemotaxis protein